MTAKTRTTPQRHFSHSICRSEAPHPATIFALESWDEGIATVLLFSSGAGCVGCGAGGTGTVVLVEVNWGAAGCEDEDEELPRSCSAMFGRSRATGVQYYV
jgi:hypothetical protein